MILQEALKRKGKGGTKEESEDNIKEPAFAAMHGPHSLANRTRLCGPCIDEIAYFGPFR